MHFEILEEKENPLLKRKESVLNIDYEGGATPKKEDLMQALEKKFIFGKGFIDITKIISEIGLSKGKAFVRVWEVKPPEKKKKGEKSGGEGEGKETKKQK